MCRKVLAHKREINTGPSSNARLETPPSWRRQKSCPGRGKQRAAEPTTSHDAPSGRSRGASRTPVFPASQQSLHPRVSGGLNYDIDTGRSFATTLVTLLRWLGISESWALF